MVVLFKETINLGWLKECAVKDEERTYGFTDEENKMEAFLWFLYNSGGMK